MKHMQVIDSQITFKIFSELFECMGLFLHVLFNVYLSFLYSKGQDANSDGRLLSEIHWGMWTRWHYQATMR